MKIEFPKPTVHLLVSLDSEVSVGIYNIGKEKNIPTEVVMTTLIEAAYREYTKPSMIKVLAKEYVDSSPKKKMYSDLTDEERELGMKRMLTPFPKDEGFFPADFEQKISRKITTWLIKFKACRNCNSTEKKHMSYGLCIKCYFLPGLKDKYKNGAVPSVVEKGKPQMDSNFASGKMASKQDTQEIEFSYCANPKCPKPFQGKFVMDTGYRGNGLLFCSYNCYAATDTSGVHHGR